MTEGRSDDHESEQVGRAAGRGVGREDCDAGSPIIQRVAAHEESGQRVGRIRVEFDGDGCPPMALRDQYGGTWVLVVMESAMVYRRAVAAEGYLEVTP